MKRIGLRIGVLLVSVLLCLVGLELFLRAGIVEPTFGYPFGMNFRIVLDRDVLYRVVPHSSSDINSHGYRDAEFPRRKGDTKRVLFLGDSFVMGLTSSAERTIPNELERLLGEDYEVFNMGVYGYGPDQSLRQLLDDGLSLDPDVVILALFPSNDFNDIYKNRLFRLDADGELQPTVVNAVTAVLPRLATVYWTDYLLYTWGLDDRYFLDLFLTLHKDTTDFDLYQGEDSPVFQHKTRMLGAILGRFRDELQQRNIDFLTIIIPGGPELARVSVQEREIDPYYAEAIAARIVTTENVPLIDYTKILTRSRFYPGLYAIDRGGEHLGPFGHEVVAKHIYPFLMESVASGSARGLD
jgi:hypothetical protein